MMTRLAKAMAAIVHSFAGLRRGLNGGSCAKLLVSAAKGGTIGAVGGAAGWHHFAGERLTAYLRDGRVQDDPGRFERLRQLYESTD